MLVGVPLTVIAIGALIIPQSVGAGIAAIIAGLLIGGLMAAVSIPCVYTLSDDGLKIKSGLLEDDVPLRAIRAAEKSTSLWSAPALSLQRVKITLEGGFRVISPKDRDGFIADLDARLRHAKEGR